MLGFFRKYQRYFFLVITVVIVISFSFFGTYNTLQTPDLKEQIAFQAVDGTNVSRSELDEMVLFLSTDSDEKTFYGGAWGPNFLNDGVIKKDFLQTGIAEIIVAEFPVELEENFQSRFAKEKRFSLYEHPQAKFISTETAWSYFAPDLKRHFETLRNSNNPLDKETFAARVRLYLGEKKFPPTTLHQVIRYQEKQYSWVTPDAQLGRSDLSLFGYHSLEDWFGPRFLRIAAEYIINCAKIAEKQGYAVSKSEALVDLIRNSEISFRQNINSPQLGVTTNQEYFDEQLRRMGMDQNMAVKVWQNVLLFRRLTQDAGNSVFVDPSIFASVGRYTQESVSGELYQLPKDLQLGNYQALQKFEIYLEAVADQKKAKDLLQLPLTFLASSEVAKKHPELVQERYLLKISQLDKNQLLSKVGIKETWNWEIKEENWNRLKKEFPELSLKKGNTEDERFATLDSLDSKTRNKIDSYAAAAIVDSHPEWITEGLAANEAKTSEIGLSAPSGRTPFIGLKDSLELIALLNKSQGDDNPDQAQEKLNQFTADGRHYYKIDVLEKLATQEILTFGEANRQGILDTLLTRQLETYYKKIRSTKADLFKAADGSWKNFETVKEQIADLYFAKILNAIKKSTKDEALTGNLAAPKRLLPYVTNVKEKLQKNPETAEIYIKSKSTQTEADSLKPAKPLEWQWQLERQAFNLDRGAQKKEINAIDALAMPVDAWSSVESNPNGAIYFYQKKKNSNAEDVAMVTEKVNRARKLLSDDIQQTYAKRLIADLKAKNAISLDYLNPNPQMD